MSQFSATQYSVYIHMHTPQLYNCKNCFNRSVFMNAIGFIPSHALCTHTMLYSPVMQVLIPLLFKQFILAYLLLCKMCGHLSYPWVVISISRRSHYRLIELTISMKRIQKHSYHMLSPSKFHLKPADTGPVAKHANLLFIHAPAHYIFKLIQLADWYITSGEH